MKIFRVIGWQTKSAAEMPPIHSNILLTPDNQLTPDRNLAVSTLSRQMKRGTKVHPIMLPLRL